MAKMSRINRLPNSRSTTNVAALENPFIFALSFNAFLKESVASLGIAGLLSRRIVLGPPPRGFSLNTLPADRRASDSRDGQELFVS